MARRLIMQRFQQAERGSQQIASKSSFSSSEDTHSVSSSSSEQDSEGHGGNNLSLLLAAAMMEEGNAQTRGRTGPFPPPVAQVMAGGGAIEHPSPHDVLSGRGSMVNNHPGNIRYRELCNMVKAEYLSPDTRKMHKSHISARIVRAVRDGPNPGRFLKRDARTGQWHEVGDKVAFRKTGQALREKAPQFRLVRGQGSEGGGSDNDTQASQSPAPPLAHRPMAPPVYPAGHPLAGHPGRPSMTFDRTAPPSAAAVDVVRVTASLTSADGITTMTSVTQHPNNTEDERKPASGSTRANISPSGPTVLE